jgi:hypothetical protein
VYLLLKLQARRKKFQKKSNLIRRNLAFRGTEAALRINLRSGATGHDR